MDWKTLFFTADGRISRQSFWIGVLILFGANAVGHWLPFIGFIIWAVSVYCAVCLNSKRLHDIGKSGWLQAWVWGAIAVLMVVGMAVGGTAMMVGWAGGGMHNGGYYGNMGPGMMSGVGWGGLGLVAMTMGLSCLVWLVFILWMGLTPGEPGANKYGEPPTASPLPAA
jgi:uncharacterized membrane protein YhaH (DUF805 family)